MQRHELPQVILDSKEEMLWAFSGHEKEILKNGLSKHLHTYIFVSCSVCQTKRLSVFSYIHSLSIVGFQVGYRKCGVYYVSPTCLFSTARISDENDPSHVKYIPSGIPSGDRVVN